MNNYPTQSTITIIISSVILMVLIAGGLFSLLSHNSKLKKWFTVNFRPPLQSDNLNDTLKLNRWLSKPFMMVLLIVLGNILAIVTFGFIENMISQLPEMLNRLFDGEASVDDPVITRETFRFHFGARGSVRQFINIAFFIFLAITSIRMPYMIRLSYSEEAMNKGGAGTSRWTTLPEIMEQYKEIEMYPKKKGKTTFFDGKGGMPVARWRDKLYIDYQLTNNLFLGATRSGKGEMFVFPMIDVFSRPKDQRNRPSMIIFDPKLELYKGCYDTLKERGYVVRLLNLDNPMKSAGYNPLAIIAEYYKRGKIDEAQQLAKSFSFGIFNSNADTQEPIWKNTATDLWTAMIISIVSDCIDDDAILNAERIERFNKGRQKWEDQINSNEFDPDKGRQDFINICKTLTPSKEWLDEETYENYTKNIGCGIPDYVYNSKGEKVAIEYEDIYPNEKSINCFSALSFFKELVDTTSVNGGEEYAGAKKADTALDDYFNSRPPLDYAKQLYASIKSAGDRTKGSVYINMQSALSIFTQDNIARLTAESDIDIASIGFDKEHPTAIFLGLPTEDKSNHFLALNFVTQVFQYLWKLSKEGTNKLDRQVQFILDEFGNMPILDNFDGMVTNCLGAGMAFNIFLQSYNQLHSKYELDMDTIKDNFANQFYILAVGQESANEFSEQLGNKTIIEVQRSGTLLSMKKSIMENNKERPLLFPAELQKFKEGETALIRASKRTDRAGASIESFPIYDEYQNNLYPWWYIIIFVKKILIKRFIKHDCMKDRDTGETLTSKPEFAYWLSQEKRWQGTAFLYRYQYATEAFPNPTEINFFDIFKEKSRESIDYLSRVVDFNKIKENKLRPNKKDELYTHIPSKEKTVDMLPERVRSKYIVHCANVLGVNFKDELGLSDGMNVEDVINIITNYINNLRDDDPVRVKAKETELIGVITSTLRR